MNEHTAERGFKYIMHVLQVVHWDILGWDNNIMLTIIANSWLKTLVLGLDYCPMIEAQAKKHEKGQ